MICILESVTDMGENDRREVSEKEGISEQEQISRVHRCVHFQYNMQLLHVSSLVH